jgi:hypothetical protein
MDIKQVIRVWKDVFGKWRYCLLVIFIAIVFYSLNIIITSWRSLMDFYSTGGFIWMLNLFFNIFVSFKSIVPGSSAILIIISILLGILFSMLIYKAHFNISFKDEEAGVIGGIGAFIAAFFSGCAACGVGIASAFGIGAGILASLPFHGIELSIAAILILAITIFKTTKNMYVCNIDLSKIPKSKALNKGKSK